MGRAVHIEGDASVAECLSGPAPGRPGSFPWVAPTRPAHVGTVSSPCCSHEVGDGDMGLPEHLPCPL